MIWILINTKRGIITEPEIFYSLEKAEQREKELMKDFNRDYDEIAIFEKNYIKIDHWIEEDSTH